MGKLRYEEPNQTKVTYTKWKATIHARGPDLYHHGVLSLEIKCMSVQRQTYRRGPGDLLGRSH